MATVRVPGAHDKVYKVECMFSFDTPLSPGGLYVSLSNFQAFGKEFVGLDQKNKKNRLYLHQIWRKVEQPSLPCSF